MSTDHGTRPRVDCTVDADGEISFGLRPPPADGPAHLLLRLRPRKGQPEKTLHRLPLEPAGGDRLAAVLGDRPALDEGRWDVYLVRDADGSRQRLRPGLRDLRALVDGQTRDRRSPVRVRIPYVTLDGFLAIRAWAREAHAEAAGVHMGDGAMTVTARLHGAVFGQGAAVRLRRRGGGPDRVVEPRIEEDQRGFSFTADFTGPTAGASDGGCVWDVFVEPAAGTPPVRVGRLLDDVADRKNVFVLPSAPAGDVVVRPYYTVDNDLAVEAAPAVRDVSPDRPGMAGIL
ncbi:transferase [Streptomyces sp. NPDC006610]|uniref:transferase n=1 Tax=Streptomyces sp. NPDC006610 TaxID=3154584 RepID=UPI0033A90D0F